MKKSLLLLLAMCLNAQSESIKAKLSWNVTTNWHSTYQTRTLMGWYGGVDPNITTYYESGTVSSNLVATINWKNEKKTIVLESIQLYDLARSYTIQNQRICTDPVITSRYYQVGTNIVTFSTNLLNFTNIWITNNINANTNY